MPAVPAPRLHRPCLESGAGPTHGTRKHGPPRLELPPVVGRGRRTPGQSSLHGPCRTPGRMFRTWSGPFFVVDAPPRKPALATDSIWSTTASMHGESGIGKPYSGFSYIGNFRKICSIH